MKIRWKYPGRKWSQWRDASAECAAGWLRSIIDFDGRRRPLKTEGKEATAREG